MAYGFGEGFGEGYVSPNKREGGGLSGPPAGTRFGPSPNMRNEGQENAMTLANMAGTVGGEAGGKAIGTALMEGAGTALSGSVAPTLGAGIGSGTAIMGAPAAAGGLASTLGAGLTAAAPILGPLALPALAMSLFNKGTPNVEPPPQPMSGGGIQDSWTMMDPRAYMSPEIRARYERDLASQQMPQMIDGDTIPADRNLWSQQALQDGDTIPANTRTQGIDLPQTERPSWYDPSMSMEDIMDNVRSRAKQKMMERQMQVPPQGMENPTAPATPRSPRAMEPSGDYLQRRRYNPSMSADPTPAGMVPTFNYPLPAMVDAMGGARSTPMVDKTTPALPAPTIWDKIKDVSVMRGVNNYLQGMQGIQGPSFNRGTHKVAGIDPQKYNSGTYNAHGQSIGSIPNSQSLTVQGQGSSPVIPIAPPEPNFWQRWLNSMTQGKPGGGGGSFASYQGGPLNIQGVPMSDREMKMDLHQQRLRHNEDKHQKTMYA